MASRRRRGIFATFKLLAISKLRSWRTRDFALDVTALATAGILLATVANVIVADSQWNAMKHANETSKAQEETADRSRQAAENEQKAWISLSPLDIKELTTGAADNDFVIDLQNTGNTPALSTEIHKFAFNVSGWTTEFSRDERIKNRLQKDEDEPDFRIASFAGPIAPSGKFEFIMPAQMELSDTKLSLLRSGLHDSFYLHIRVNYKDVYSNERVTEGVYQLVARGTSWILITAPFNSKMQ